MPPYLLHVEMWKAIWPVPLVVLVVGVLLWLPGKFRTDKLGHFLSLLSFSMLGVVTGLLAGFSREPVVGAILPPVLSLVGGLAIYLVGKDTHNRVLVSLCVLALSFNLLIGGTWGAVLREEAEEYKNSTQYLQNRALTEIQVEEFRKSLRLPTAKAQLP